jgi:hypothetical protein
LHRCPLIDEDRSSRKSTEIRDVSFGLGQSRAGEKRSG